MVNRDGAVADTELEKLGKDEMLKMLKFGASCVVQSSRAALSDAELDAIIDRTSEGAARREACNASKLQTECQLDACDFDAETEALDLRRLGDVQVGAKSTISDIGAAWKQLKPRERESTTVMVDG